MKKNIFNECLDKFKDQIYIKFIRLTKNIAIDFTIDKYIETWNKYDNTISFNYSTTFHKHHIRFYRLFIFKKYKFSFILYHYNIHPNFNMKGYCYPNLIKKEDVTVSPLEAPDNVKLFIMPTMKLDDTIISESPRCIIITKPTKPNPQKFGGKIEGLIK